MKYFVERYILGVFLNRHWWQICSVAVLLTCTSISNQVWATSTMHVSYDHYELSDSMVWEDLSPLNPSSMPSGTIDSQVVSGSILTGGPTNAMASAVSNMGMTHSIIDSYYGSNDFDIDLGSNYDNDCPSCLPDHGIARAEWSLLFDVQGGDGWLEIMGWMPNGGGVTNQVLLTDITAGSTSLFNSYTTFSLLDGHSYSLNALSEQTHDGLDDLTVVDVGFRSLYAQVPESAAWLLLLVGLFVLQFNHCYKPTFKKPVRV